MDSLIIVLGSILITLTLFNNILFLLINIQIKSIHKKILYRNSKMNNGTFSAMKETSKQTLESLYDAKKAADRLREDLNNNNKSNMESYVSIKDLEKAKLHNSKENRVF